MAKIIYLSNFVLYVLFRLNLILGSLLEYIFSFKWLKLLTSNSHSNYDNRFRIQQSQKNISLIYARNAFFGILLMFVFPFFVLFISVINTCFSYNTQENSVLIIPYFILYFCMSLWISYILIYKDKRHLSIFEKIENLTIDKRKTYYWISALFIVTVTCVFVLTLLLILNLRL